MSKLTLLDLTKARGYDRNVGIIESVTTVAPELATIPGRVISGTSYKTLDRNALPATGFTNANEGITPGKSSFAVNPFFPALRSGRHLLQRPSPQKQIPSRKSTTTPTE